MRGFREQTSCRFARKPLAEDNFNELITLFSYLYPVDCYTAGTPRRSVQMRGHAESAEIWGRG